MEVNRMSRAVFRVDPPESGATMLRDGADGHVFTPKLPGSWKRVVMILNDEDYEKVGEDAYTVTDQMTDEDFDIIRADCGAGCYCAAEIVV